MSSVSPEPASVPTPPTTAGAEPIRVVLVDDHQMFRDSVARLLAHEPDIEVLGTAGSVDEGVDIVARLRPSVAIVDFALPDGDGTLAAARILEVAPQTRVLILTGRTDEQALAAAIEAGCSGFVTKDHALQELVEAVRRTHVGDAYIPAQMLASLLPRIGRKQRTIGDDLTSREREVLELLGSGLSNRDVAAELVLSVHTVRNHVQNLLVKLQAHSKLEAVAIATREGLINRPTR